uniref:Uncharacterized protein n=1 Tax=Ailuropoda melanoleuca TaxID=9646 RepID=G1M482_AILME
MKGQSSGMPRTHLEVLGIHVQLVTVQLAQLSKRVLEVIHMFNSISKGGQHLLSMGLDLGVAHYCRLRGQVPKTVKEPLGPWINNQEPMGRSQSQTRWEDLASNQLHIHPGPQANNSSLLLGSKIMNHGVWYGSLLVITDVSKVTISCFFPEILVTLPDMSFD